MKILQAKVTYDGDQISSITVLVDFTISRAKPFSDVRAIMATNQYHPFYINITPDQELTRDLLVEVANSGCEIGRVKQEFPGWSKSIKNKS